MKNSHFILPAAGFVVAIGCALTPRPEPPAPYYGINPDTGTCTEGVLSGQCGGTSTTRCTIIVGDYSLPGFDVKSGSVCSVPVYRPSSTETPPTPDPTSPGI